MKIDGVILELIDQGEVKEIREKVVISSWASTGTYYFRKGKYFVESAENEIKNGITEKGEYNGPLYNKLILKGKKL